MRFCTQAAIRAAFLFCSRPLFFCDGNAAASSSFSELSNTSKLSLHYNDNEQQRKHPNRFFRSTFFLILLCSLFTNSCPAQENEKIDENLGEIQVTAPTETVSPEKPSAFTTVIDPKPFENQVKTLPEILSQQPGVNVQQFGGLGQLSTISIRGSTAEQVTVLIDGVKINTAQGGAVDFSSIPLDSIDHIEIIRGGSSVQYGSDAIGGAVNIVTKKAKKKQAIEFASGGGSFTTIKTTEGFSKRFENISFVIDHTHLQSKGNYKFKTTPADIGGIPIGGGETFVRDNNSFFSENGLVRVEGAPTDKINFSLTTDWFGSKREVPPTEQEVVLLAPANPPEAKENILKNLTTLRADFKSVGWQDFNLFFQPYYRYDFSHFTDPSSSLGGVIDVKNFNQSEGGKLGFSYLIDNKPLLQTLKWQYEFQNETFNNFNLLGGPSTGFHKRMTNALYASDELSLWDDQLILNPSVRFEHTNDFGAKTALHFGIIGKPTSWVFLKSNVDNSFRYPSFNELYFPNEQIIRGNPTLKPEGAVNVDAGAVFKHPYGKSEVSYFFNRIENSIIFVPISAFTIQPINTKQVHMHGIEASTLISPWKHLDIEGNYTYLLAHLVQSDTQLPGRPRQKANAKLTFKNKWGSFYGQLQFIDNMPIDVQNTTFLRRRAQIDVGGNIKFFKHYYFAMEVKDITNIQMIDARGFPLPRLSAFGSFGVRL